MQKVVVTGSSGRIGSAIVSALPLSFDVIGVDRIVGSSTNHIADISDASTMQRLCQGAIAVIHSAALHAPHVGAFSEDEFHRINVESTVALAKAACAEGVERFIFTSTTALYGYASTPANEAAWITEQTVPQPAQSITAPSWRLRSDWHHWPALPSK